MQKRYRAAVWILLFGGMALSLRAQTPAAAPPPRPAYQTLRFDEDWSFLRKTSLRSDFWDPIKFIPLNSDGSWFLTLGGETRFRYEAFYNSNFGNDRLKFSGRLLQRHSALADLHAGTHLRFFGQLLSALDDGHGFAPRSTDIDRFDLHQSFMELRFRFASKSSYWLRLGRQEIDIGSSRLIATKEPQNVRQRFDGVRFQLLTRNNTWTIGALAVKPVVAKIGVWDDWADHAVTFTGAYLIVPNHLIRDGKMSFYWAGYAKKLARYDQGTGKEYRNLLGTRYFGLRKNIDYNDEFILQLGTFGRGNIRAWTLATDNGYNWTKARLHPRFGVGFDVSSGDKDRNNPDLQTFNALFANNAYSDKVGLVGPANSINLNPSLKLFWGAKATLVTDWNFYWRQSLQDGIYLTSGTLLRTARNNDARFVASQPSVQLVYNFTRHLAQNIIYTHVFPGQFLRNTPPAKDLDYVTTYLTYKF